MDCKDCDFYEEYSGQEYPNATWHCKNKEIIKKSSYNVYWSCSTTLKNCKHFNPKQPNNDKSRQPVEKVEKTCGRCKNAGNQHICCTCDDFRNFQPIPKPGQATVKPRGKFCSDCKYTGVLLGKMPCRACGYNNNHNHELWEPKLGTKPPKRKEQKMWKKLRKRGRRITMAWDLFGVFLLCKLVNPWVVKLWHFILPKNFWDSKYSNDFIASWLLTIASIAAIIGSLYALDRLAAWWYGEK